MPADTSNIQNQGCPSLDERIRGVERAFILLTFEASCSTIPAP